MKTNNITTKRFVIRKSLLGTNTIITFTNKKNITDRQKQYWFNNGKPIHGILAKLIGSIVIDRPEQNKRKKIISEYLQKKYKDFDGKIIYKDEIKDNEKKELMLKCLRLKYSQKKYADLLLKTEDAILHEIPLRGGINNWTYKNGEGGDWLGQLLILIREELQNGKL